MDVRDYAELVKQMRADQKAYFEHRTGTFLAEAKASERMVDRVTDQILRDQPQQSALPPDAA